MATVAELKAQADSLGVEYSSKVRKPELELMVTGAIEARKRVEASRAEPMDRAGRMFCYRAQNRRRGAARAKGRLYTHAQLRRMRKADNRAKARA